MKVKQKQWQLFYLGFYGESTDDIDGIWGPKSIEATEEFQRCFGLEPVDGVFGKHSKNKSREVISAIQRVITAYAKAPLVIDGLAGPSTMSATVWYQKDHVKYGLTPNGMADKNTRDFIAVYVEPELDEPDPNDFWDEIEYFTREELKCKCGGRYCDGYPAEPKEMLVRLADRARRHFGKPAHNVSTLRDPTWNRLSGGVANSQHVYGEAMDIRIDGVSANELYSFLKKQPEVRYTYKINSTNVHFDVPKGNR